MHHRRAQKRGLSSGRSNKRYALYIHTYTYMMHVAGRKQKPGEQKGSRHLARPPPAAAGPHSCLVDDRLRPGPGGQPGQAPPPLGITPPLPPDQAEVRSHPDQPDCGKGFAAWKGSRKGFQVSLLVSGTQHPPTCSSGDPDLITLPRSRTPDRSVGQGGQADRQTGRLFQNAGALPSCERKE